MSGSMVLTMERDSMSDGAHSNMALSPTFTISSEGVRVVGSVQAEGTKSGDGL